MAVTAMVLFGVACVLPLRRGFHPAEWYFVTLAAALALPGAAWARTVIKDLALAGTRAAGVVLLSWLIPLAAYGLLAGPVWVSPGTTENDLLFAVAGVTLFTAGCAVATGVLLLERRRRDHRTAQPTGA
jgi:hypothetical protein